MTNGNAARLALPPPAELLQRVRAVREAVASDGGALYRSWRPRIGHRPFRLSALNFAHYLVLRRFDLRDLQVQLMPYGLSSLGRLEARVLANLDAVAGALAAMVGEAGPDYARPRAFFRGDRLLSAASRALLGTPRNKARQVRIMVTMARSHAEDAAAVRELVAAGTEVFRINCAHDGPEDWRAMVSTVRAASRKARRRSVIVMDLGGPKCRIGKVKEGRDGGRLRRGDAFLLTAGKKVQSGLLQATCTLPVIIPRLKVGEPVFLDDGRLGGVIEETHGQAVLVRVRYAPEDGGKLKAAQGVNFPASDLGLPALTETDRAHLDTVAELADVVGYSFVQSADDVVLLQNELAARRPRDWHKLGLIAKIETPLGVHRLPEIIVQAASRQPFGVMIARGDLAVEIGFERLAEMQEELLWLCEAAQVPVVWATQVLESLVKHGLPTRGDMTDAAMAARAECVMLNKGPHAAEAVALLDRLLSRMAEHQTKKTSRLRALKSW